MSRRGYGTVTLVWLVQTRQFPLPVPQMLLHGCPTWIGAVIVIGVGEATGVGIAAGGTAS